MAPRTRSKNKATSSVDPLKTTETTTKTKKKRCHSDSDNDDSSNRKKKLTKNKKNNNKAIATAPTTTATATTTETTENSSLMPVLYDDLFSQILPFLTVRDCSISSSYPKPSPACSPSRMS